jgi:hypothetical protein
MPVMGFAALNPSYARLCTFLVQCRSDFVSLFNGATRDFSISYHFWRCS